MCTGRVDLAFIFRAFLKGADGVIIGGCWPGECHYVTEGNYDALGNMYLTKKLLAHIGVNDERLRLEWISASEGSRFAEVMSDFAENIGKLGPIGGGGKVERESVDLKLEAVNRLIPYIKLVERERFRIEARSEDSYREFYTSEEASALFDELIAKKLTMSQIMLLLGKKPLSTSEISKELNLDPSSVSRYMNTSSRQGLVRFDQEQKCYSLA